MGRRLKDYPTNVPFGASIATTGTTDIYFQAGKAGTLAMVCFAALLALAANDTNYVTFSVTNLGQGGLGTTEMLAATDANTTKATGGSGLVANARRILTLSGTAANLAVAECDTIRIRATVTGTLGAAITVPRATVLISASGA
jgi:hypothetical protein